MLETIARLHVRILAFEIELERWRLLLACDGSALDQPHQISMNLTTRHVMLMVAGHAIAIMNCFDFGSTLSAIMLLMTLTSPLWRLIV